ncbi:hypothetical protein MJO28_006126 [Puccinia striiformis f. sp. tritici]|nr:hypothetical protein MJO28_006126 [Puccinia striiformis f. sp. tritici]KAI7957917.1 hypothetical protein MJO29_006134 [Puccinia striiformis f. sp. tritici]POW03293.1 hypothetical protein PSTT_11230 [Puccinia striiformis]POW03375.1 hypothetical protein PSHT_11681 [Puccinia striiformis]
MTSSKSWSSISFVALSLFFLTTYSEAYQPSPDPEVSAKTYSDVTVCDGENILGFISNNQETGGQFYQIDKQGKWTIGLGTCTCAPMGPAMGVYLWSCSIWPRKEYVNYRNLKTLPYCTEAPSCAKFGTRVTMAATQSAKICQGAQQVGVLYEAGQAMPANGKSKDIVDGCSCSAAVDNKPSIFSCANSLTQKFGTSDPNSPFVCVNPQQACPTNPGTPS